MVIDFENDIRIFRNVTGVLGVDWTCKFLKDGEFSTLQFINGLTDFLKHVGDEQ